MWPKLSSAALLLCGSLLFSTPPFVVGQGPDNPRLPPPADVTATTQIPLSTIDGTLSSASSTTKPTESSEQKSGESPRQSTTPPASPAGRPNSSGGKANTGAIAGGVVAAVVVVVLISLGIFLFIRKRRKHEDSFELEKSPPTSAAPRTSSPSGQIPPPHQQPISPREDHALMSHSHYGDSQPQGISPHPGESAPQVVPYGTGEVIPAVGAPKPSAHPSSREIDDDEISIDAPSPPTTPNPERQQQRSVPRLPMYQSRDDSNTTSGL